MLKPDSPLQKDVVQEAADRWIFRPLFFAMLGTLLVLATWANLDLTESRAGLFMDEMIPFDNVRRILNAPSPAALGWALADGGDHRYGRILYNVTAPVAWLPHKLWGDRGLIIALRGTQAALLAGAMVLLCLSLIKSWRVRTFALLAMATLPYADYFLTQPKPEPVQLMCYALFLVLAARRSFGFGWHWLFLGMAFGAKISAVPLCAAAAGLAVTRLWIDRAGWQRAVAGCAISVFSFGAGWIAAIPMLAVPTRARIDAYLGWTFKATGHGSDDSRITALDWLKSLLTGGEVVRGAYPAWITKLFLIVLCFFLFVSLASLWRRRGSLKDFFTVHQGWLVLSLAASLLIPIVVAVKRLWGIYLFPGQLLAIVAVAGIVEQSLLAAGTQAWRWAVRGSAVLLAAVTLLAGAYAGKAAVREYRLLASRTSDAAYLQNLAIYKAAMPELTRLVASNKEAGGAPLDVLYDPYLFPPESTPDLNVQPFWSATIYWDHNPAVLVIGRKWHLSYFLHEKPLPPPTAAIYPTLQAAVEQFALHVESNPAINPDKPYQLVRWFGDDAALILRKDLAERWRRLPSSPADPRAN